MHKSWAIIFFMSFFGLHLGSSLDWETDGCSFVHSSPQHWACPVHEDEMDFVLSTCLRSKPTWLLVTAVLVITSDYLAKASPLFPTYLLAFISRRISRTTSRNARCAPREFHFRPCCCSNPSCFEHEKGTPFRPLQECTLLFQVLAARWLHWRSAKRRVRITPNRRIKARRTMEISYGSGVITSKVGTW